MKNITTNLIINLSLFVLGIASAFSGLVLQLNYHIGNHGGALTDNYIFGINYYGWSDIHTNSVIILTFLIFYHIYLHRKWYKTIIKKKLFFKHKTEMAISILFVILALTGFIPWLIKLSDGSEITRHLYIEIHDKAALIFLVYLVIHIINKYKWYFTAVNKIREKIH